jgi:nucleoside-diphosphate-sugar epimerase
MRFHTVYSENPRKDMFFDKLLNGGLKYITNHERDFIHVSDVCSAIKLIMSLDIKGSLDVGTGISSKIHCMVRSLPLKISPRERQKTKANTKLLRSLGFKCTIDLETFLIDNWDRITKANPGLF